MRRLLLCCALASCSLRSLDDLGRPDGPPAYFVVGDPDLSHADEKLARRITGLGLRVVAVDDDDLAKTDTAPAVIVIVSKTANSAAVGSHLRDTKKPVVLSEPGLYDDMGLVDAKVSTSRGLMTDVSALEVQAASPLGAGLAGTIAVTAKPLPTSWGTPAAAALRVATIPGLPDHVAIFAYDAGAMMSDRVAPARRVALFLSDDTANELTDAGWKLFDAGVSWALGR